MLTDRIGSRTARFAAVTAGVLLAAGLTVTAVPANAATTSYTFTWSRADTEAMYNAINTANTVCGYVPMPVWMAGGCGGSATLREALNQAHYQKKRIRATYYDTGFNYSSYYTYKAIN